MFSLSFLSEQFLELLGVAGFVFYMLAYALLQLGKISGQSYSYTLLNMLAASLVLISLFYQYNLASLLIQVSWIVISMIGLIRLRFGVKSNGTTITTTSIVTPTQLPVSAGVSDALRQRARQYKSARSHADRLAVSAIS